MKEVMSYEELKKYLDEHKIEYTVIAPGFVINFDTIPIDVLHELSEILVNYNKNAVNE